jgi:hypothetical protein
LCIMCGNDAGAQLKEEDRLNTESMHNTRTQGATGRPTQNQTEARQLLRGQAAACMHLRCSTATTPSLGHCYCHVQVPCYGGGQNSSHEKQMPERTNINPSITAVARWCRVMKRANQKKHAPALQRGWPSQVACAWHGTAACMCMRMCCDMLPLPPQAN